MTGTTYDAISNYSNPNPYTFSNSTPYDSVSAGGHAVPNDSTAARANPSEKDDARSVIRNPGESTQKKPGRESSPAECETCSERKYQDGSDENVSFKAAAHIDPSASASRVRSHEQEHVNNAYKDAAQNNGKVISCNVSTRTSVCPECGRTYVSGGTTATQIKYYNEENPYQKDMKSADAASKYRGRNIDTGI